MIQNKMLAKCNTPVKMFTDRGNITTEENVEDTHVDKGPQNQLSEGSVQWEI